MSPSLVAVAAVALLAPAEIDAKAFSRSGAWPDPLVEAAVQKFLAKGTSASERADLAASDALRPYLYLTVRRAPADVFSLQDDRLKQAGVRTFTLDVPGKVAPAVEDALLRALAVPIRKRLEGGEFAKRIDLLMEAGIITANHPEDPKRVRPQQPPFGRPNDPTLSREAFRQIQELLTGLEDNPVVEKYTARLEKGWRYKWPHYLREDTGRHQTFGYKTADELLKASKSAYLRHFILAGERLELDDKPEIYVGSNCHLLRYGMNLRPNPPPRPITDEFTEGLFVCGDTARFGTSTSLRVLTVAVVDGDLELPAFQLTDSLYIASGSIHIIGSLEVQNSWFIAGGDITGSKAFDTDTNTFVAGGKIGVQSKDEAKPGVRIEDKAKADLGLNFFKSEEVGVTFDPAEVKAVVKAVADDSPLRGVLRPGDVVTAVNDREVRTEGAARRALREAVVLGFAFVTRARGKEAATMTLASLSGWPKPLPKPADKK